jgi:hypothetical protein
LILPKNKLKWGQTTFSVPYPSVQIPNAIVGNRSVQDAEEGCSAGVNNGPAELYRYDSPAFASLLRRKERAGDKEKSNN